MSVPLSSVIVRFFDRGELPAAVRLRRPCGGLAAGTVARWNGADSAFVADGDPDSRILAAAVRELWGATWEAAA